MKKLILLLLFIPLVSFGQTLPVFSSESSVRAYYDNNKPEFIEGIWEYISFTDVNSYRLAIIKDEFYYKVYVTEKSGEWNTGDVKATFERVRTPDGENPRIITKWTMGDKISKNTSEGYVNKDFNTIVIDDNVIGAMVGVKLVRTYPK